MGKHDPPPPLTDTQGWLTYVEGYSIPSPAPYPGMSDCWIWQRAKMNGYGVVGVKDPQTGKNTPRRVHRVLAELLNGSPIPEGLFALHKCDVPACVNPDHGYIGTPADNMRDRTDRGRANMPSGDEHWTRDSPPIRDETGKFTTPDT